MSVFIVAEIGVNAGKDVEVAKRLIDAAAKAGANATKMQLWQRETFPHLEHLRLNWDIVAYLANYILKQNTMEWFCTPFDVESIKFLAEFGMKIWKIPSNPRVWRSPEMLSLIANQDKVMTLVSLGLFENDIQRASRLLPERVCASRNTYFLHCVSEYPTSPEKMALKKNFFEIGRGISDHSGLPEIPVAAVALGAKVVECHITLDKNAEGPDHKASLTPDEFALMVRMIRNVEKAIQSH